MIGPEQMQAFVLAVELGSFSAAARRMGKAQSAVSTAIANLEIDVDLELFDRSGRSPVPTEAGAAMLPYARSVLRGQQDFLARATSLSQGAEASLCLAIEEGTSTSAVQEVLCAFVKDYPDLTLELLDPGPNDVAILLKEGRADLGLMIAQDHYPQGFQFRGVGYLQMVPVCGADHPLAKLDSIRHADLRQYRQMIPRSRSLSDQRALGSEVSPTVWYAESPYLIADLLRSGLGWAELPMAVAREGLERGDFARLSYDFQQNDVLEGIDVVWTDRHGLGSAGLRLLELLLALPEEKWRD